LTIFAKLTKFLTYFIDIMKKLGIIFCLLWASLFYCCTLAQNVLKPSLAQLHWQEQERIMFVHFGMATWQGSEGDNWTTPLNQVNPTDLNTDQWCEVAQSWGAKMVLFVAKHVGGFCWWQTDTSDYGVRQIPWRDGKGDVLESLSASCRKYNLDLGVYIYPGDEHWGAMVGSGGITSDPSKQ
jgi:alpha-L-fucosidase